MLRDGWGWIGVWFVTGPVIMLVMVSETHATHRVVEGVELGFLEGSCENVDAVAGDLNHVMDRDFPSVLLSGDWTFSSRPASRFEFGIVGYLGSTTVSISSGIHVYDIDIPAGPNTCNFKGRILSYQVGDGFRIGGPCAVEINTENDYPLYLTQVVLGQTTVETFPLVGEIFSNGSHLFVRKRDASGAFNPEPFVAGELFTLGALGRGVSGPGESDEPFGNPMMGLKFITTGTYEIEVVWRMPAPANGSTEMEVSRTKKRILVGPRRVEQVNPRGTGGATTKTITFQIDPLMDPELTRVAFVVERQSSSGGHEAAHHTPSPADGKWEIMERTEANPITHPTGRISDQSGQLVRARADQMSVTYAAPEFGGLERVRMIGVPASFPAFTTQKDLRQKLGQFQGRTCHLGSIEIEVKVPDLGRIKSIIPGSSAPPFVGEGILQILFLTFTRRVVFGVHVPTLGLDNSHHVNRGTKWISGDGDNIKRLVREWDNLWYPDHMSGFTPLQIMDISLEMGGTLDFKGDWRKGHRNHATGTEVDFINVPTNSEAERLFKRAARRADGRASVESVDDGTTSMDVFHVDF